MNPPPSARILLVDDNRVNRRLFETKLAGEGYEVLSAPNGEEALAMLRGTLDDAPDCESVDLAVLDILMPGIDGYEVLRRIRKTKSPADLPVIMATAVEQTQDIVDALKSGANDYIVKPVNFPILLARIETQLSLKNARQSLKLAQESLILAAKTESVSFLAAGVAHEIRNPLARIQLGLQSLERNPLVQGDQKLSKSVSGIKSACDKADRVVGELMKLAKKSRPNLQALDIEIVIREALGVMRELIESQHIQVQLELNPDLPPARYSFLDMRQVIVNIVLNAIQSMPEGGTLAIRTGLQTIESLPNEGAGRTGNLPRIGDEMISIEIDDSGPGFANDSFLTAFDAFYTTKPTNLATGLGLTLARKMLALQGGLITLANRPGGGARVTLLMPKSGGFQTTV